MGHGELITDGVYIVGGPNITDADDAASFVVRIGGELVMIDSGAGNSFESLQRNMEQLGLDCHRLTALILTHCHIDHIGSAPYFREHFGCRIIAHEGDARAIEEGDPVRTAARWYGTTLPPTIVDTKLSGEEEVLTFGNEKIRCIHTPGHTPGSISIVLYRGEERILFGQDIHGPFNKQFGSDIGQWKKSMAKLLVLEADILCEGHFGIFRPKDHVRAYIRRYLKLYA
jgi:glyoxylase-like metal-dependent hydrolase (beta-lactamase superfamily II)